ncbi:MAG TPA: thioredoxin domain-containing protein [Thermoanaerobaculia bacterium]|nr:thioredoxin domain-containing protein [Thermoanaerobaculia bacterium]
MKQILFAALMTLAPAFLHAAAPTAATIEQYALQALPDCASRTLKVRPATGVPPAGFVTWEAVQTGPDPQCATRTFVIVSTQTDQTIVGDIFPLPDDARPLERRVEELSTRILKTPVTATVRREIIPDGLKSVIISKQTRLGPFSYQAYVDRDARFMIVGTRGNLKSAPGPNVLDGLGIKSAATRGAKKAKVQIVEISDLQCPTCKQAHEALEPIVIKNLSAISFSRIDLPLFESHDWALNAALAARAIQKVAPAHYWNYVDFIFENQETIKATTIDGLIKDFTSDRDIDWKKIEPLYRSTTERQALLDQVGRAFDRGIFSTPTFFVNGRRISYGVNGANLLQTVKAALAKPKKQ